MGICFTTFSSEQCLSTSGQIAHYAFRQAEQLLKNDNSSYNPKDPFLGVLSFCPGARAHAYALLCGDAGGPHMILSKWKHEQRKEREVLKKIARNIVYVRLNKENNNSFCLGEHSECEKLLRNINEINENKQFCVVFNNPADESLLHVMKISSENTNLKTHVFSGNNNEIIDTLPDYMSFMQNIVVDSTTRNAAIKQCLYSQFSPLVAQAELARLSGLPYVVRLWNMCPTLSFSFALKMYIAGMLCCQYYPTIIFTIFGTIEFFRSFFELCFLYKGTIFLVCMIFLAR